MSEGQGTKRRDLLKAAVYVAPAILTFPVAPAAARSGSERNPHYPKNKDKHDYHDWNNRDKDKHDYDDKDKRDYENKSARDNDDKKSKGKSARGGSKDRD